jgi:Mg2+ and Co2+ transporter CorA
MIAAGILVVPQAHAQAAFTDVSEVHPFYEDVTLLSQMEVIQGYEDGSFRPDAPVSRAAALKMIFAGSQIPAEDISDPPFPDVPVSEWFARFVAKAKQLGIVKGNPDGTYRPAEGVNKAGFIKMLLAANGIDISEHQNLTEPVATDVPADAWFAPYLSWAKTANITTVAQNGALNPSKQLTRGEVAAFMARIIRLKEGGEVQENLNIAESKLIDTINAIRNKDIVAAEAAANEAVEAAQSALQKKPDETIVQGATKITLAFQQLVAAYKSGIEQKYDEAIQFAGQAKALAAEGIAVFEGIKAIADQVTALADQLISEATTMKNAAAAAVVQPTTTTPTTTTPTTTQPTTTQPTGDIASQIQQIQAQMQQITDQYNAVMTQLQQQLQQLQGQLQQQTQPTTTTPTQ